MMFFWDSTYILVIIGLVISMMASGYVNSTFRRYSTFKSKKGYSAQEVASLILQQSHINDVGVQQIAGDLTDNYNAQTKMLSLSETVYHSSSVSAIGVAAHECGHALQDNKNYVPLKLRSGFVPVANFGSTISVPLILLGVLLQWNQTLITIGLFCFSFAFLFQVITLPVEFDASRRAITILRDGQILDEEELAVVRKVLFAAALTYVAALLASLLQLLRMILLFGGNRRND